MFNCCWTRGDLLEGSTLKIVVGAMVASSAIEKASIIPPCDGVYTDFTWQYYTTNGTDPAILAFGDIDLTNDIMPESTETEAILNNTNAEVLFTGLGAAQTGVNDPAVIVKHSKNKVHAKGGKPISFGVHQNSGSQGVVLLTAQFIPKNGATMVQVMKDATYQITNGLQHFIRINHDGWLKKVEANYGIDGGAAPFNGMARSYLIRNNTELNETTFAGGISGDVYHGDTAMQDHTIGSPIGKPLMHTGLYVEAATEFKHIPDETDPKLNVKVYQGDIIAVKIENDRGTVPDNISVDLRAVITIRNSKRKKRNVFIDGTHVINLMTRGNDIMGVHAT